MPSRSRASSFDSYLKRAVVYHASAVTVLWVVLLFVSFGIALTLLVQMLRLNVTEQAHAILVARVRELGLDARDLRNQLAEIKKNATSTVSERAIPPGAADPRSFGTLTRGSMSPDGKKYAGYDDGTQGKRGISVIVIGETRVRHITLFNPRAESSGIGTPEESSMSVRWIDTQTIEYDVIVKQANGQQSRETRTTKIYF